MLNDLPLDKIISGGQTGADSAGLDWAIANGLQHGGWCPKGRKCEDGQIDARYQLTETASASYLDRTERNVSDSDGTIIFTLTEKLSGGSLRTEGFARKHAKPCLHFRPGVDPRFIRLFIVRNGVRCLNVAGSRGSSDPRIYDFVMQSLNKSRHPDHL